MSLLRRVALAVNDLHAISVLYLLLLSTFVSDLALVCSVLAAGVMHGHGKWIPKALLYDVSVHEAADHGTVLPCGVCDI